jgi:hypothetical protein
VVDRHGSRTATSALYRLVVSVLHAGFRQWAEEYLPNVMFTDEWKHRYLGEET